MVPAVGRARYVFHNPMMPVHRGGWYTPQPRQLPATLSQELIPPRNFEQCVVICYLSRGHASNPPRNGACCMILFDPAVCGSNTRIQDKKPVRKRDIRHPLKNTCPYPRRRPPTYKKTKSGQPSGTHIMRGAQPRCGK